MYLSMMSLRLVFLLHGIITLLAAIVLVSWPEAIPRTAGIELTREQYLLCWFLAAAEFALGYLSIAARNFSDPRAIRSVCRCFFLFHLFTALMEAISIEQEVSVALIANAVVRVLVAGLFFYYSLRTR
ncbi:MAG: hypothetical protein EOO08_12295 [Chitinophagaceae bacterium]|nr:MAG: hypothetical protein EOO08_12295 [Chitinophagaceae bacterium]